MRSVKLSTEEGKIIELNILEATRGRGAIDIAPLCSALNVYSYDPGLALTATCDSEITFIDGEKGELYYRDYPIEEIAESKNFLEVCYLLLSGCFPSQEEYKEFDTHIRRRAFLHEKLKSLFDAFPDNSHPMATLSSATAAVTAFYHNYLDPHGEYLANTEEYYIMAQRIIAKLPTIAAYAYRKTIGLPYIYPDTSKYFTENFLYMLRAYPNGYADIKDIEIEALDKIFLLHADHGQNASTTAVKVVCSTGAPPYAAISAGISALWGPAHGGANEAVIKQLEMIGDVSNIEKFIAKAKDKNDPFRLMGFGHRVYKNYDPRAKILKQMLERLKGEIGIDSKLLEIAYKIEEIALKDSYFIERKLYPNVDFYSGIILTALKIPVSMFTPIFVIGRSVGWISQWFESRTSKDFRIVRPAQRYIGASKCKI